MRFSHELRYDADPGDVFAMVTDPGFREAVCEHQQVLRFTVTVEGDEGLVTVDVDQVQAARGIPPVAARFVGDEIEIEQREVWHSPEAASFLVTIPGKPARLDGSITLRAQGEQTVETFTGDIEVSIPFVGAKIESMVGDLVHLALRAEHAVGVEWLSS
ncbi:MAG: DUF2505 domain-containing protein [Nocardioides sp.]